VIKTLFSEWESFYRFSLLTFYLSIDITRLIFVCGIHSWTNAKMKVFTYSRCKEFKNNILSLKRISKFNDSSFRIKVYTHDFNYAKFVKVFENLSRKSRKIR